MQIFKNSPTIKIIASYIILSAIAIFVCVFLYQQINKDSINDISEENKVIDTGAMISALYEADSYAALSLQSLKENDFKIYAQKNDSLITTLVTLKEQISLKDNTNLLDTISKLLNLKKTNIEQLRFIKIANNKDNALDAILSEFKILETNMGRITLGNFIENPEKLTKKQKQTVLDFTNYVNSKKTTVPSEVIDSTLTATRKIVRSAKINSLKLRKVLLEQEEKLVRNDLEISIQLRKIISNLSNEINEKQRKELQLKNEAIYASNKVVYIAGWVGAILMVLFSYLIISDFFKAQRLKNALQKEQEKTKLVLESREQLIASVSHDLKTPLTTISGYTELLEKTNLDTQQLYYNNAINENAQYINHLAQDLLDFSKLEANKITIVKAPFQLSKLLEKVLNNAIMLHSKIAINTSIEIDNTLKNNFLSSDPLRIEQIVTNLLSNAFKFTKSGSINIKAFIKEHKDQQPKVFIKVSDTGIGISSEKLQAIFDPFKQANKNIVQQYGGSGLGLAISRKLATLLNGTLTVESTPYLGSTFTFSFPYIKSNKITEAISTSSSPTLFKEGIIIDDDESLLKLLEVLFLQLNIKAHCFSSFENLKKNTPKEFDFILTDLQMPEDNGEEILKKIYKGIVANYKGQPIFLMSGNLQPNKEYYQKLGFKAVIAKPFTLAQLAELLNISTIKKVVYNPSINRKQYTSFNNRTLEEFLPDKETSKEVVKLFIEETNKNMATLSQAILSKNDLLWRATAHKMGTMSKQLEAKAVTKLLSKIENPKTPNNTQESVLRNLEIEISLLTKELKHYLNQ